MECSLRNLLPSADIESRINIFRPKISFLAVVECELELSIVNEPSHLSNHFFKRVVCDYDRSRRRGGPKSLMRMIGW